MNRFDQRLDEIEEAKQKLEQDILGLLKEITEKTGIKIEGVVVNLSFDSDEVYESVTVEEFLI